MALRDFQTTLGSLAVVPRKRSFPTCGDRGRTRLPFVFARKRREHFERPSPFWFSSQRKAGIPVHAAALFGEGCRRDSIENLPEGGTVEYAGV
jgi:hypothetical protein